MRDERKAALTVVSQIKYVHLYEHLWRAVWGVAGDLGRVPAPAPGAPARPTPAEPRVRVARVRLVGLDDKALARADHAASRADAVGGDAKAAKAAAKAAKKARKLAGSPLECAVFQGHVDFTGQKGFTAAALVETSAHVAPPASSALRATIGELAETPQWAFGGAQVRANFMVRVSAIARRKLGGGCRKPKRVTVCELWFNTAFVETLGTATYHGTAEGYSPERAAADAAAPPSKQPSQRTVDAFNELCGDKPRTAEGDDGGGARVAQRLSLIHI